MLKYQCVDQKNRNTMIGTTVLFLQVYFQFFD